MPAWQSQRQSLTNISPEMPRKCRMLSKIFSVPCLKQCFREKWILTLDTKPTTTGIRFWHWQHVEHLFNYGSAVRKVMYTTNAIEAVNSNFGKITKRGSFSREDAVRKALYLRITELYQKWNDRPVSNLAMVRNKLSTDDKIQARIMRYENI